MRSVMTVLIPALLNETVDKGAHAEKSEGKKKATK